MVFCDYKYWKYLKSIFNDGGGGNMKKYFGLMLIICGVLSLSACSTYQSDMNNPLPNEHNAPLNQTMPANNDSSVSMD